MKLGKIFITVLGIASALLIGWGFIAFMTVKDPEPEHVAKLKSSAYIKTERIKNDTVAIQIKTEGRVHNASILNLISEVKGEIVSGRNPLKEGSKFKKGDLIFLVSNPEAKYALKAIRSGYIQLITSVMPDLKMDFGSGYKKWESFYADLNEEHDLPSLPEVNDAREKMFLSNRQVYKAYYEIKSKEAQYHKHFFYAPFDGVLMHVNLEEGSQLNPGMSVGVFGKNSEKEIEVSLSHLQAGRLQKGAKVAIQKPHSTTPIKGVVSRVSDFINPSTQSFSCFIKVLDQKDIKDGEYYEVLIDAGKELNAVKLAAEAIYSEESVQVLNSDSTVRKENIQLLYYDDDIAVVKGLKDNDVVVNQKINAIENRKYKALK